MYIVSKHHFEIVGGSKPKDIVSIIDDKRFLMKELTEEREIKDTEIIVRRGHIEGIYRGEYDNACYYIELKNEKADNFCIVINENYYCVFERDAQEKEIEEIKKIFGEKLDVNIYTATIDDVETAKELFIGEVDKTINNSNIDSVVAISTENLDLICFLTSDKKYLLKQKDGYKYLGRDDRELDEYVTKAIPFTDGNSIVILEPNYIEKITTSFDENGKIERMGYNFIDTSLDVLICCCDKLWYDGNTDNVAYKVEDNYYIIEQLFRSEVAVIREIEHFDEENYVLQFEKRVSKRKTEGVSDFKSIVQYLKWE